MKRVLLIIAAALFCAFAPLSGQLSAQTTVTGTFLTSSGQTPQAANLRILQRVAGTNVCGQIDLVPYNASVQQPWSILWNGVTYSPQNVRGWIRCSDGAWINSTGALGVAFIPTTDAQPSGTLAWFRGSMTGSTNGAIQPVAWSLAKAIPDQSSVDWGN